MQGLAPLRKATAAPEDAAGDDDEEEEEQEDDDVYVPPVYEALAPKELEWLFGATAASMGLNEEDVPEARAIVFELVAKAHVSCAKV